MKKWILGLAAVGIITVVGLAWANPACIVDNCQEQGGSRWSVGGSIDVISGGDLDIESGAALKLAGTTITSDAGELNILTGVTATAAELNRAADVSARIVTATASTLAISEALHDGKIITMDRAGGIAVTMPEATGSGMVITFVWITKFTTDGTITLADVANTLLLGQASIRDSDTTDLVHMFSPGSTFDLVTLDGTNKGGGLGTWIQYVDIALDKWSFQMTGGLGGTAPATPFSSTP